MKTLSIVEKMRPVKIDPIQETHDILDAEVSALIRVGFGKEPLPVKPSKQNLNLQKCKNPVYTNKEIARICFKYDFRFLPVDYWKGHPPVELGRKIVAFSKRHGREVGEMEFRLLAPVESFDKYVTYDPILLAKVPGEEDKWEYVHHWGEDMSIFRGFVSISRLFTMYGTRQAMGMGLASWPQFLLVHLLFLIISCAVTSVFVAASSLVFHTGWSHLILFWSLFHFLIFIPFIEFNMYRGLYWNRNAQTNMYT